MERLEFQNTRCDFCQSNDYEAVCSAKIVGDDFLDKGFYDLFFTLVKCKNCDLVYINPRPTKKSMSLFYPPQYYDNDYLRGSLIYRIKKWIQSSVFKRHGSHALSGLLLKFFVEPHVQIVVGPSKKNSKALEIGFGSSDLLDRLKEAGWQTYGIETDHAAIEKAKRKGHKTFLGFIENLDFGNQKFDVVVMQNVLEHVYSPSEVFKKINSILVPGGELIVSVPNFGCAQSRIFGGFWYGIDAPRHLFHFTPITLRKIAEKFGFKETKFKKTSMIKKLLSLKVMFSFTKGKLPLSKIAVNVLKEYFYYFPRSFLKKGCSEDFDLVFTLHFIKLADL